jgi:hypothetical protein
MKKQFLTFVIILFSFLQAIGQTPAPVRIQDLPVVTEANATALIPIVQDGVTSIISASDLTNEYIRKAAHDVLDITTTQTINLSTTVSLNIIKVINPGLTLTLQFPTSPVEGQIVEFTTLTNTVNLVVGTSGTFSLDPTFAGAPTAGYSVTYCYHEEDDTYYRVGN